MVTCPRCGGELERYELGGRAESSCSDCGYVGVPVEHGSDRETPESWGTAIRRFREKHAESDAETEDPSPPEDSPDADAAEETDADGETPGDDGARDTDGAQDAADDAPADPDTATDAQAGTSSNGGSEERSDATAEPQGGVPGDADERDAPDRRANSRRTALLRRKKRRDR